MDTKPPERPRSTTKKLNFDKLNYTTLLLFYLFFSGGLFLTGFWVTFKIDVSSFVSITDIPKGFILSLSNLSFWIEIALFIGVFFLADKLEEKLVKVKNGTNSRLSNLGRTILFMAVILLVGGACLYYLVGGIYQSGIALILESIGFLIILMSTLLLYRYKRS